MRAAQFRETVRVAFAPGTVWSEVARRTAIYARARRAELESAGRLPRQSQTFVNGVLGAREEEVRPGGAITYRALLLGPAVQVALDELRRRAPRGTRPAKRGQPRYVDSFHVSFTRGVLEGRMIPAARFSAEAVSADATECFIFSNLPFSRRLNTQIAGGRKINVSVSPGFFQDVAALIRRRFPRLDARFLNTVRFPGAETTQSGRRIEYPAVWISTRRL